MRSNRNLIVAASLLLIIGGILSVLTARTLRRPPAFPTTYSAGPEGCKALYLVLKELGLPVERYRRPLKQLKTQSGVLAIIDPRKVPFSGREIKKLKEWIRTGNRLILFQGAESWIYRTDKEKKWKRRRPAAGIFNDWGYQFGLEVASKSDEPRRNTVPVALPGVEGLGKISVSSEARWKKPLKEWSILAKDEQGPILVTRKMGKGDVVALSDMTLPTNKFIDKEHNLKLLIALLLEKGRPQAILFDEYHHGRILHGSLMGYIGSSVFLWILAQGFLAAFLIFYTRRARLAGRYHSLSEPVGRSSLEYVQSMANIFASCKAAGPALDAILRRFLLELSRRSGISMKKLEDDSDAGVAVIAKGVSEETGELVAQCRRVVRTNDTPDAALELAQRLAEAQKTLSRVGIGPGPRRHP